MAMWTLFTQIMYCLLNRELKGGMNFNGIQTKAHHTRNPSFNWSRDTFQRGNHALSPKGVEINVSTLPPRLGVLLKSDIPEHKSLEQVAFEPVDIARPHRPRDGDIFEPNVFEQRAVPRGARPVRDERVIPG